MYAILPLSWPSRVVCSAARRLRDAEVERARGTPSTPTRTFCGDTSRCTMPSGSPRSFVASCAAWRPCSTPTMIAAAIAQRACARRASAPRGASRESDSPCTYSMTRKSSPLGRDDVERRHDVRVPDARGERAPRRGTSRRTRGRCANCGCSRLIATVREKPTAPSRRPKCTVAIPPEAISSKSA